MHLKILLRQLVFSAAMMSGATEVKASQPLGVLDHLVYASQDIQAHRSDFQGPTAAGGHIRLENFLIEGRVAALGTLTAPTRSVRIQGGRERLRVSELVDFERSLERWSQKLNAASDRRAPVSGTTALPWLATNQPPIPALIFRADPDQRTHFTVSTRALETAPNIVIEGSAEASMVVHVTGDRLRWSRKGIFAVGGIRHTNILWYFSEARELHMEFSGGSREGSVHETVTGIPGAILAPCAELWAHELLITGQVFVKAIRTRTNLNTAQINHSRSVILSELDIPPCPRCS